VLSTLFYHPMHWSSDTLLWLVLPLCASLAIVYKTVRTRNLRRLPIQIVTLIGLLIVGMAVLVVGFWLFQKCWA